jgi:integrase
MVTSSRKLFCVTGCPDCDWTWKNAGISAATVQDILGHESVAISQNYGRIDEAAKRTAIWAIPALLA